VAAAGAFIAIVGSVDSRRADFDPPLREPGTAKKAAEQVGQELRAAGYRLIVFSSAPSFIEADVVRGYLRAPNPQPKSIIVRFPSDAPPEASDFSEHAAVKDVFDFQRDRNPNWDISYYRSLQDMQGIVLIGGGRSTLITGVLAQTYRIPLVTIAAFGGSAEAVWALGRADPVTDDDWNLMGQRSWSDPSARLLVQSLARQREVLDNEARARQDHQRKQSQSLRQRAIAMIALIVLALLCMVGAAFVQTPATWQWGALFIATPLLAGAAGGLTRMLIDEQRGTTENRIGSPTMAAALGLGAGVIAAILFVVAQMASNPDFKQLDKAVPDGLRALSWFALLIGFVGGLTLQAVYGKLESTSVVSPTSITEAS
jgi:hypothetical protein